MRTNALLAALLILPTLTYAQGASVSGVVRDSLSHGTLAGATVQIIAAEDPSRFLRSATSDSLGRFMLEDVPLGRYKLGFFHPLLDSLGIEAPLRDVFVDSYRPVIADVAVPGPARLRAAICGAQTLQDSGGVVIGTVRDAETGKPAAGAKVQGQWLELSFGRGGLSRHIARTTATTSQNGWFSLCDVPAMGSVVINAVSGTDSTAMIETRLPPEGLLRRELYLAHATVEAVTTGSAADSTKPKTTIRVGKGRLSGTVVAVADGRPLANAQVRIIDGPQTRTNDRGEWTITNAPQGTRTLEVRALGFYPTTRDVDIIPGAPPVRVALPTFAAVLDTVKIIANRNPAGPDGGEFLRRRKTGMGRFITSLDMKTHPVVTTSDVFRRLPGVRLDLKNETVKMRGAFTEYCDAFIFINGTWTRGLTAEDIDDWVPPDRVAGIEVYTESNAPPQFQVALGGCGSIVIWTK